MRKLIITLLLILVQHAFCLPHPTLYALHINGIRTTRAEGLANVRALKDVAAVDSNMVKFDLIWNPSGDDVGKNIFSNLEDVVAQKAQENQSIMTLDDFTDYYIKQFPDKYPLDIYHKGTPEYTKLQEEIPSLYKEELNHEAGANFDTIVNEFHGIVPPPPFASVVQLINSHSNIEQTPATKQTIKLTDSPVFANLKTEQTLTYDYSRSMDYILLIPHSQGNLYANALYEYLTKNESLGSQHIAIYGIATPASENKGSWISDILTQTKEDYSLNLGDTASYITADNDFVINTARSLFAKPLFKGVLPANIHIPFSKSIEYGSGHSLIDVYLADNAVRSQIAKMIHFELLMQIGLLPISASNFLFSVSRAERGGGLIGPAGVVCLDGNCNSDLLYFSQNSFERELSGDDVSSKLYFAPKEYYPVGEYMTIATLDPITGIGAYVDHSINHTSNYIYKEKNDRHEDICRESLHVFEGKSILGLAEPLFSECRYAVSPQNIWFGRYVSSRGVFY